MIDRAGHQRLSVLSSPLRRHWPRERCGLRTRISS